MSRRAYPILGRPNLRSTDVNITASKPVYLRIGFLEGGLETSLGPDPGPVSGPDPGPDLSSVPGPRSQISQILVILYINRFIRPFDWIYL